MPDTLVIVESPAKAKTIEKFLGTNYKVIASNGHIRDLPKSQLGVDVENDFAPKYITLRGRGDVLEKIRKEYKNAKKVYLATDPDREGEAISWHLAKILKLDESSKCRIVFNEITSDAVKASIKQARAIDTKLVDAQQARRILDRLVGYKLSPILWAKIRGGLSAGRVQSVATRIICDREQEIIDFIPEEFWTVTAFLEDPRKNKVFQAKFFGFNDKKTELHCIEDAEKVEKECAGKKFITEEVKTAIKTKHAPPPFTTSSLQQDASRKLNFTTKRTMQLAQKLYEGVEIKGRGTMGLITYMRTDSVRISAEAQAQAREYVGNVYGGKYLPERPNFYKGSKSAQDAHEAVRPTNVNITPQQAKESLDPSMYKLYKLIHDRFVASQMTEMVYEATAVSFLAGICTFKSTGTKVLFDGYTAVYTESRDEHQEKELALPELLVGDELTNTKTEKEQHFTQPPPRYTEASLVKLMEEKGIGRPSTYAPTISTIIDRGYVTREKKMLIPTELGFVVTQMLKENFNNIVDLHFTADMEKRLDDIEEGEEKWVKTISDFYGPFSETIEKASKDIEKVVIKDEVSDIPCDKCGAMMVYKMGRFGRFLACPQYPECKNTKAIVEKLDVLCPKCGGSLIKRKSKKGKVFYGCEKYPECDFVSWDKPTNKKCPECGEIMIQKVGQKGSYTACSNKECGYVARKTKKEEAKTTKE